MNISFTPQILRYQPRFKNAAVRGTSVSILKKILWYLSTQFYLKLRFYCLLLCTTRLVNQESAFIITDVVNNHANVGYIVHNQQKRVELSIKLTTSWSRVVSFAQKSSFFLRSKIIGIILYSFVVWI